MSLNEFQKAIFYIYTVPQNKYLSFPFEKFNLDIKESVAIASLREKYSEISHFSESLARKQFHGIRNRYGFITKLSKEVKLSLFSFFRESYDFVDRNELEIIDYFKDLLYLFANSSNFSVPSYFSDLVKFDYCFLKCMYLNSSISKFDHLTTDVKIGTLINSCYFIQSSLLLIENFSYDVYSLPEVNELDSLIPKKTCLAFVANNKKGRPDIYRISSGLKTILSSAHEAITFNEITEKLLKSNSIFRISDDFEEICFQAIYELIEKKMLVICHCNDSFKYGLDTSILSKVRKPQKIDLRMT